MRREEVCAKCVMQSNGPLLQRSPEAIRGGVEDVLAVRSVSLASRSHGLVHATASVGPAYLGLIRMGALLHEVPRPALPSLGPQLLCLEQVCHRLLEDAGVRAQRPSDLLQPLTLLRTDLREDAGADLRQVLGGAADALAGAGGTTGTTASLAGTARAATAGASRPAGSSPARRAIAEGLVDCLHRRSPHEPGQLGEEGVDAGADLRVYGSGGHGSSLAVVVEVSQAT